MRFRFVSKLGLRRKQNSGSLLLQILLCLALLTGAIPVAPAATAQAQMQNPSVSVDATADDVIVQAAGVSALDAAPAEADALVSDPRNPQWQTRYGSLAGKLSLAPRYATLATASTVAEAPIGAWQTQTLQAGANGITALIALPDGQIYAGVSGDGLRRYAPDANGVYTWSSIKAEANGLASNAVTALALFKNQLWVGTANAGISVLDLAANTWSTFNTGNGLPSNVINRLTVALSNEAVVFDSVWASTEGGAAHYSKPLFGPYAWSVIDASDGLPSNSIYDIAVWKVESSNYTLIATDRGLRRLTGATINEINGGGDCLFDRATRLVVDHQNALWLAVQDEVPAVAAASVNAVNSPDAINSPNASVWLPDGVCRHTEGLFIDTWAAFNSFQPGLPSNLISDMSVDNAGRIWMSFLVNGGASTGGVASYDQGAWLIFRTSEAPIGDGAINRILAVGEAVWAGRNTASVAHIYSPNWNYYDAAGLGNGSADDPGALLVEATRTWAASGTGLAKFENDAWSLRAIPNNTSSVTSIVRGADGLLYLATAGSGLFAYDGANTFTRQTAADGLPSNDLRALAVDQDGQLWVATAAGLALRGNGYWLVFDTSNSGIASNDLRSLTVDESARLWIGTAANGVSIFDSINGGANAWSTLGAADGLPADAVNALATDPAGFVWIGTSAGLVSWRPVDSQLTTYTTANGLPGNEVLSIAANPAGIIWVGTDQGLGQFEALTWGRHHVSGSFLGADHVRHLAADDKQVWSAAGKLVAVRGVVDGPIGDFPPEIDAITPLDVAPLQIITITGKHFDERFPAYNKVTFCCIDGQAGIPAPVAQVLSSTTTSLLVQVPLLAKSGKINVKAHNLTTQSDQEVQIVPVITSISETCAGPGTLLEIHGRGFFGVGSAGAYVTIGNGPERLADMQDPTLIRQYIRQGDTTGVVKVRLLNNKSTTSFETITIANPFVTATAIQQGVQGEQMVWGKRTLVQVFLRTTYPDYCNVTIDKGQVEWKKKDGTTQMAGRAIFPSGSGLQVPNAPPAIAIDTGINFVAEFNTYRSSYYSRYFPLPQFNGVKVTLKRGIIDVMTVDIPASKFNFVEIGDLQHIVNIPVVPQSWTPAMQSEFWANARKGIDAMMRVYPQPDVEGARFGERQWSWDYHWSPVKVDYAWLGDPGDEDDGEPADNFGDMKDSVDDIREALNDQRCDGGNANDNDCAPWMDQAMGIVDLSLFVDGGYGGKATVTCYNPFGDCDRNSAISFNITNTLAPIYLQEAIHALQWVDTGSANHDADNEHHSRYDEGQWENADDCNVDLTFRRALLDQVGGIKRVIRLDDQDPYEFPMPTTKETACARNLMPRSAMSYVPNQRDANVFLEPIDYRHTLNWIRDNGFVVQSAQTALANVDQTLRINGKIDQTNKVTVTMSSILGTEGALLSAPSGDYHLLLIGANSQLLYDHAFNLAMEHTHTDASDQVQSRFNLRVPFPAGVQTVAIQHDGIVLWAKQVSANAPTASFTAPNGGSFNAADIVPVTWQAADADGDALQYALDYTPDNGTTWFLITNKLTETHYDWTPGFVPASSEGRLRLRVSDAFNTAEAMSAPFELTAQAPLVFIDSPVGGTVFTEGSVVDFTGGSLSGDGFDTGAFEWSHNGLVITPTRSMTVALNEVGVQFYDLKVTANGLSASASVSVTVLADYDRDGMPNAWEQEHSFNPVDPADALNNPDDDGLSNLEEYKRGTNPLVADTDGDARTDGAELSAGTDPLVADQAPSGPVLQVGATKIGFSAYSGGITPTPQNIWVTNGGPGDLNWSAATSNAPWLELSVTNGAAPTEVTFSANADGLAPGVYTGTVTFTAAGAAASPQEVAVTLKVVAGAGAAMQQIFLPLVTSQ